MTRSALTQLMTLVWTYGLIQTEAFSPKRSFGIFKPKRDKLMPSRSLPSWINAPLQISVAAVLALFLARLLHLPEAFWAPISAIVCSLDAVEGATRVARRRLLGTFFGVTIAALQISLAPHGLISYALAVVILGLICGLIKLHPSAFRFGAIALTVVVTSPDKAAVWLTASTRFADVALGILVALAVVRIWPKLDAE